ncbi:MAG: acyl carrier protein [Proteobacteria bacterium]|jgi:acyl carrier protein|nr:acyl carrier protein [Pseudomonadota bacterium]
MSDTPTAPTPFADADRETILAEVQQILIQTFQLSEADVAPEKNLYTDLDLDSLDAIDMAAELSNRTQIKFENDDLRQIRTVNDVVETILRKQPTP